MLDLTRPTAAHFLTRHPRAMTLLSLHAHSVPAMAAGWATRTGGFAKPAKALVAHCSAALGALGVHEISLPAARFKGFATPQQQSLADTGPLRRAYRASICRVDTFGRTQIATFRQLPPVTVLMSSVTVREDEEPPASLVDNSGSRCSSACPLCARFRAASSPSLQPDLEPPRTSLRSRPRIRPRG